MRAIIHERPPLSRNSHLFFEMAFIQNGRIPINHSVAQDIGAEREYFEGSDAISSQKCGTLFHDAFISVLNIFIWMMVQRLEFPIGIRHYETTMTTIFRIFGSLRAAIHPLHLCNRKLIGSRSLNYLAAPANSVWRTESLNLFQNFEEMSLENSPTNTYI